MGFCSEVEKCRQPRWKRKDALLYYYGLTEATYNKMLEEQGGGCAICGRKKDTKRNLHVDHDHKTGAIRGILCSRCNVGLGQFLENTDLLHKAAEYLISKQGALK